MLPESIKCLKCTYYEDSCLPKPDLFKFVAYGVFINIISIVGIILNVAFIFILMRKQIKTSFDKILVQLEVFDTLVLISCIFTYGIPSISEYCGILKEFYLHGLTKLLPIFIPLTSVASTGVSYSTVLIAMERYVAVCHPRKAKYLFSNSITRLHIILLTVLVVVFNTPGFFIWKTEPMVEVKSNMTYGYSLCTTPVFDNRLYSTVYRSWVYLTVYILIPVSSILTLSSLIYRTISDASRNRQSITNQQRNNYKMIPLFFAIKLVYVVCYILTYILIIMVELWSEGAIEIPRNVLEKIPYAANILIVANSASKFSMYCYFHKKLNQIHV